ncbi:MAG: hypothetical protein II939_05920 [Bacteroidales bacterium]|nr:hypothetical protein [Bacteroidales bacterium]
MDIQAIIKQVISLAGLVIKNPSTSVKGSGIDFGSLIGMAGSMLGGKSGSSNTQGGGMDLGSLINIAGAVMGGSKSNSGSNGGGDILGSVLGGLMGGGNSSNSGPDTPSTGSNNDGGGLGSILGGLAGMAGMAGMGNAMGNMFSREEASSLMSDVTAKEDTISDMLKNKDLNQEEKGNLTDMLGLLQVAGAFLKK